MMSAGDGNAMEGELVEKMNVVCLEKEIERRKRLKE